nr:hypothetical protein [uncultured Flavobacterium sp.]
MKSSFFYLLALLFLLTSCSNDSSNDSTVILPKSLKVSYPGESSRTYSTDFVYDGSRIVSISDKFEKIEYEYDGNKITRAIHFKFDDRQQIKTSEILFTYQEDKLSTVEKFSEGKMVKYVYVYNSDGTIKKQAVSTNENKIDPQEAEYEIFSFAEGNLTKGVSSSGNSWGIVSTFRYQYDTNNNAYKNILGYNLLLDQGDFGFEINTSSTNNLKMYNLSSKGDPDFVFEPFANSMIYQYNSKGYPVKKTIYDYTEKAIQVIEYFY